MDNSQFSSPSRRLRGQRYARKFGGEWACTGDRLRCVCKACKFYRREHWGLTALSSSEESSSEDEEGGEGHVSSRRYHQGTSRSMSSQNYYYTGNLRRRDMVKYTSSISDDFSRDDKEDEIMRSSTSSQYMEAWSKLDLS